MRSGAATLHRDSREALAFAVAAGEDKVPVLIAADVNRVQQVLDEVARLRGSVVRRFDEIGYVRAHIPTAKVDELLACGAVQAAAVMLTHLFPPVTGPQNGSYRRNAPEQSPVERRTRRMPLLVDPLEAPYSPLPDLMAETFRAANPTFDGRGVTIALIDGFLDQLLPELQTATGLDGGTVRKVRDVINPMDPAVDGGPEWITEWSRVTAINGRITSGGREFDAPYDGDFQLGFLDESRMYFRQQDLSRDGNPEGSSPLYAVLWDRAADVVWVDTDQDDSFTDERPLTDYRRRHAIGIFGVPEPGSPVRESMMFTVQTRPDRDAVAINVGAGSHATMVAGATFGSRGRAGRYDGIAPGVQIISVNPHPGHGRPSAGTYLEALIAAMSDPRVDLVVYEDHAAVHDRYPYTDGGFITSVLAQRLVELYDKPMFVPVGNTAFLNQVCEEAVSSAVIGVGAYESGDCYRINSGILLPERDNLHCFSSFGPAGDGGMTPLLLAPSDLLSSELGHAPEPRGAHRLPAGYAFGGGTSTATPAAAAAVALLISAAKQSGISYDVHRLRQALCTSARFISTIPAHAQGNGLIQVEAAWHTLRDLHNRAHDPSRIDVAAPVRTTTSAQLRRPHQGRGLYEREGWAAGDHRRRVITVTRRGGEAEPATYALSWQGNDGTFATSNTVTLARDEPTDITVAIAPTTPGVHSALLELSHPSLPADKHRILTTVVTSEPRTLTTDGTFSTKLKYRTAWPAATHLRVPEGASVVQFQAPVVWYDLDVSTPDGKGARDEAIWTRHGHPVRTWLSPTAGVWEAALIDSTMVLDRERHRMIEATPRVGQLTAAIFQVDLDIHAPPEVGRTPGSHGELSVDVTNRLAAFSGGVLTRPLGVARTRTCSASGHAIHVHEIDVTSGTDALVARVAPADHADLDLYLFDCTGRTPLLVQKRTGASSADLVYAASPGAGTWKVVIDAHQGPSGSTTYDYLDLVTSPRYGWLTTTATAREHACGEQWQTTADIRFATTPPAGHVPAALLLVTSDNVRTPVPQPPWNPEEPPEPLHEDDPKTVHAPLGWAIVLFDGSDQHVLNGSRGNWPVTMLGSSRSTTGCVAGPGC